MTGCLALSPLRITSPLVLFVFCSETPSSTPQVSAKSVCAYQTHLRTCDGHQSGSGGNSRCAVPLPPCLPHPNSLHFFLSASLRSCLCFLLLVIMELRKLQRYRQPRAFVQSSLLSTGKPGSQKRCCVSSAAPLVLRKYSPLPTCVAIHLRGLEPAHCSSHGPPRSPHCRHIPLAPM